MTLPASIAAAVLTASFLCANASANTHLAPDLDRRANVSAASQDIRNIIHDAGLTEDAIRDWKRKYPADPWLVKDISNLKKIYAHVKTR
jgi:Trm5-related predicted tRNA methylase